jgi:hypothetical protein
MSRKTFYTLSITWGLPLALVGGVVALFLLVTGHRPHRWHGCACFELGRTRWGGLNLGLVILCQKGASSTLKSHEFGHAIQNTQYGPGMIPLVVKSACRYHAHTWKERHGIPVPAYESWWFEAQATEYGQTIKLT